MSLRLSEKMYLKGVELEQNPKGRLGHRWGEANKCLSKAERMKTANTSECMMCFQMVL